MGFSGKWSQRVVVFECLKWSEVAAVMVVSVVILKIHYTIHSLSLLPASVITFVIHNQNVLVRISLLVRMAID